MRPGDGGVLDVDPLGVRAAASGLRARSVVVLGQGRALEGIYVAALPVSIGVELGWFVATWGSAVTALGCELDLLGVELVGSADAVVRVDSSGARW
jgi:hypothetical protein